MEIIITDQLDEAGNVIDKIARVTRTIETKEIKTNSKTTLLMRKENLENKISKLTTELAEIDLIITECGK